MTCPVPRCNFQQQRPHHMLTHMKDVHGINLHYTHGGHMLTNRKKHAKQYAQWLELNGERVDVSFFTHATPHLHAISEAEWMAVELMSNELQTAPRRAHSSSSRAAGGPAGGSEGADENDGEVDEGANQEGEDDEGKSDTSKDDIGKDDIGKDHAAQGDEAQDDEAKDDEAIVDEAKDDAGMAGRSIDGAGGEAEVQETKEAPGHREEPEIDFAALRV